VLHAELSQCRALASTLSAQLRIAPISLMYNAIHGRIGGIVGVMPAADWSSTLVLSLVMSFLRNNQQLQ